MKEAMRSRLIEIIRETKAMFLAQGPTTSREVSDHVIGHNRDLIAEIGDSLAESKVRDLVVDEMKKDPAAETNRNGHEQWSLPFAVEGIPPVITYEGKSFPPFARTGVREIFYVSVQDATEEQLRGYDRLLTNQITADSKRRAAVRELRDHLSYIFAVHAGITVKVACQIWREEHGTSGGAEQPRLGE